LTKKIVVTRLPVGHTHEDIDSKFAFIWRRVRDAFVLTPDAYKEAIESSLSNDRVKCEAVDIFVVPNYCQYISKYMIQDFGRYAKVSSTGNDWTQLQWIFESVPVDEHFPCGVRTTYRKFSADNVILIQEKTAGNPADGLTISDCEVRTYPEADAGHPAGFSMLTSLPTVDDTFVPDAFMSGSRKVLDNVVKKVKTFFRNSPDVVEAWEEFAANAPEDDNAQAYCEQHPLDIPLKVGGKRCFIFS